ncbi:MAG: sugar nucleotide-binding protein [Planctomycetales bacterium]
MLRLGKDKGEVRVVTDQRCTPTSALDLATGILKLIDTEAYGLYHLTNSGSCTWFEFAAEIFRQAGLDVKLTGITTEEYGAAAPDPNSAS